jgi:hypothetical protein
VVVKVAVSCSDRCGRQSRRRREATAAVVKVAVVVKLAVVVKVAVVVKLQEGY